MDTNDTPPSKEELAALALYHQLVNLSEDDGDRSLMVTLRMPNGRYIGDVWLSAQDVQQLTDSTMAIADHRACFEDTEPAAAPLPLDDDVTEAQLDAMFAGFKNLLSPEGGDQQ